MSLRSLLQNDTCSVVRPTWSADNAGGPVRTGTTTVASGVPCRVVTKSAHAVEYFESFQMELTHIVIMQSNTGTKGDWLTTSDGLTLRIDGIQFRRAIGNIGAFYVFGCIEVKE